MASFADHPAFRAGRARSLQVESLNDIRAVLPTVEPGTCMAVWSAMRDPASVANALSALEAMPGQTKALVLTNSLAFADRRKRSVRTLMAAE
ncbi:hypothetical protein [Methylobacterium sp. J-092]|uniref:hypothetical protein n=1 Tax=Methylobacterium sp. J-092 TaxID=2836667 RepID=UPI001FB903EE|nr:hypothetical protein [Methylobacterium sp. J-092]MCJ2009785.1 hypothetical protein [Methylobacterium sp. J-092]